MATHAKKRVVVDSSEARYTGQRRRVFGADIYEVEYFAGDRSGEKVWVRTPPPSGRRVARGSQAPIETLKDVVARQVAEEAEHERRALDPDDDYPPVPGGVHRRLRKAAETGVRRPPRTGDVLHRTFKGRELSLSVVEIGGEPQCLGYEAEGTVYPSLTAAAEHYTGYPVSGPVFWGVK